jgi:hypothetical protein
MINVMLIARNVESKGTMLQKVDVVYFTEFHPPVQGARGRVVG